VKPEIGKKYKLKVNEEELEGVCRRYHENYYGLDIWYFDGLTKFTDYKICGFLDNEIIEEIK